MATFIALIFCFVSSVAAIFLTPDSWFVNVETPVGDIRGISKVIKGKTINVFYGIPYAEPPTGSLRFKKPVRKAPFMGLYDATDVSAASACLSLLNQTIVTMSEDCLRLTVFVPDIPSSSNEKKPVMIWIHGGGFTSQHYLSLTLLFFLTY